MVYYTYILKSQKDNSYYIGSTQNILRRLQKYNKGLSKFTKTKCPYKILYNKGFEYRKEAIRYERYLKSLKKRSYIEKLINKEYI